MKRRILSVLLACSLLFGILPAGALASEGEMSADGVFDASTDSAFEMPENGGAPVGLSDSGTGAYGELALTVVRPEANASTHFTVALDGGRYTVSKQLSAGSKSDTFFIAGIPDGQHTLTVEAEGYLTYTQELEFDGRRIDLTVYNNASVNEDGTGALSRQFGVMPIGDVNGDGYINDGDADLVAAQIGSAGQSAYDLNGDGTVDLTDLTIVVRNESGVLEAPLEHTVSSAVLRLSVDVRVSGETAVTGGSLADLTDMSKSDAAPVQLVPAAGGEISEVNPVEVVLEKSDGAPAAGLVAAEAITIAPPAGSQDFMTAGLVTVEGTDEETQYPVTLEVPVSSPERTRQDTRYSREALFFSASPTEARAEAVVERDGTVVINLGRRVAIKKVTIRVTATAGQKNLAEIAKVEFLSDFSERIQEPQFSIPTVLSVSNTESDGQGYKNLTVTWDRQPNVTGYEVEVSGNGYNKSVLTEGTSYTFHGDSFNGTVKSFQAYTIRVRSVSGEWKSAWSEPFSHAVTCATIPPQPKSVTAVGATLSLRVSWDCKFDAEWFTLYYKEDTASGYTAVENLKSTSYVIPNLTGGVKYTVYVVAHNRNGSSPPSAVAEGMPQSASGVEMPKYRLLNTPDGAGVAAAHITQISGNNNKSYTIYRADGSAVTNADATPEDWKVLLDGQPNTYVYIPDWDSGVTYANFRGPIIQLDQPYQLDTICLAPAEGIGLLNEVKIQYRDAGGGLVSVSTQCTQRYDSQNRRYLEVLLYEPITTDYLEIRTTTGYVNNHGISEVRLYHYDDLENTVAALFADEMHTTLQSGVTREQVQALINRANEKDAYSGEYHPHRQTLLDDLNYAMRLLEEGETASLYRVDNQITAAGNPASGFAQALSDYQPLGVVAAAGDTVVVYVSGGESAKGSNVSLKLVATQMHPEVTAWQSSAIQLKAGRNEVTIPRIGSYSKEAGGPLYLQYTGAKGALEYQVRLSGGTKIPMLLLDGVPDADRPAAIEAYLRELETYTANLEAEHEAKHAGGENANVNNYPYVAADCILNATEITMENMMFSLPATQVLAGLGTGDRADRLAQAVKAMEQEIDYFYQFKGMNREATDNDAYPNTRLNIRYHQMFTGAFMYAGGKHIGIEYGSVPELFTTVPVTTDASGKKRSGQYSGWGIAHEIGHCINAGAYQRVEVTNNVFAQLAKTDETNGSFRTTYDKVYRAVATGTTGHTGDLAVQLAMYWQLHLAYDDGYTYRVYDSVDAQQEGLFYARLESYLRTPSKAPYLFTATGGDQLLMQAACAAAGENILGFFKAWGIYPDAATEAYAAQFAKVGAKIQYIDDNSRLYRLEGKPGMSAGTQVNAGITNAVQSRVNGNRVVISLSSTNTNEDAMLGYEICRNGKVVAFVTADQTEYTDIVTTENNKAFIYTVTGIDRLLHETEPAVLAEVKVCHEGAISKDGWTAETNMISDADHPVQKDENDPDRGTDPNLGEENQSAIPAAFDNRADTFYYGTAASGRPAVTLNLGGVEQVTALKFTPVTDPANSYYNYRLFGYRIEVSLDGASWTTVKEGDAYTGQANNASSWMKQSDVMENGDGSYTLYFNKQAEDGALDPFLYTYDAAYVRLTATNMSSLAIAELDVLGPTNDNVELIKEGFGRLKEAYQYGETAEDTIPKDSVVFYGSYKGDPAYNVVLLQDQNGRTLDGSQLILAEVPKQGALGETSDGRWIFWLEPGRKTGSQGQEYEELAQLNGLESVQVELYRVQDAQTLAGQRLTSTSLHMTVPAVIPEITITATAAPAAVYASTPRFTPAPPRPASAAWADTADGTWYGDTGAVLNEEASDAPVHWTKTGDGGAVYEICFTEESSAAAQTDIIVLPREMRLTVEMVPSDRLYQTYRVEDGTLKLYTVARHGSIGGGHVTGTIRGSAENASLTASRMYFLKENNGAYEGDTIALNAVVTLESSPDVPPPPGQDVKPERPSYPGGDGGGSWTPAGGTATGSGSTELILRAETDENGTASASLSDQAARDLVSQAEHSKLLDITVDAPASADSVQLTVPANAAKNLAERPDAVLQVDLKLAVIRLSGAAAANLAGQSENTIGVKAEKLNDAVRISVQADGIAVEDLSGVTACLPAGQNAGAGVVAVIVNADGSETVVRKSAVVNGTLMAPLNGSATIRIQDRGKTFSDAQTHWAKDAIYFVSSRELFTGVTAEEFDPDGTMTRAMLAVVLHRLEDAPKEDAQGFPDISGGMWYSDAVAWAAGKGIVQGDAQGLFNPNQSITREQLAAMLYRYAGVIGLETQAAGSLDRFPDKDRVSGYAWSALAWAVGEGIVTGQADGTLNPAGSATRAEVATMLMRFVSRIHSKYYFRAYTNS